MPPKVARGAACAARPSHSLGGRARAAATKGYLHVNIRSDWTAHLVRGRHRVDRLPCGGRDCGAQACERRGGDAHLGRPCGGPSVRRGAHGVLRHLVILLHDGDTSIEYAVRYHSNAAGADAWLYQLAGLWAGREGRFVPGLAHLAVQLRGGRAQPEAAGEARFHGAARGADRAGGVRVTLFSESMPFTALAAQYLDDRQPARRGGALGHEHARQHWAMAIHPPTLFVGYAGLTIPFAYAIAAIIVNDSSKAWVVRSQRYVLFSWLFLGIGIGLGAVWAYVVLGWLATGPGPRREREPAVMARGRGAHRQLHRVPPARRVQALVGHVRARRSRSSSWARSSRARASCSPCTRSRATTCRSVLFGCSIAASVLAGIVGLIAVHAGPRHPRLPEGAPRQRAGVRLGHAGEPRVHIRRLRRPPGHGR